MPSLEQYATQTPFTDPGTRRDMIAGVGTSFEELHRAVTGLVLHYRGERSRLTDEQIPDADLRWVADQLEVAHQRLAAPLGSPRTDRQHLAGCCRDHTLLAVAILREHGIPARSRVGFADYFEPGFHHDHVVVERWDGDRWVRFDAELDPGDFPFDVRDMTSGEGAPFETAAEAWLAARAGRIDPSLYGVDRSMPELTGMPFLVGEVFLELAHRQRDEILLWDVWGPGIPPFARTEGVGSEGKKDGEITRLADEIAALIVAADAGDATAAAELDDRWATQPLLRPTANHVVTLSPMNRIGDVDLEARTTVWR